MSISTISTICVVRGRCALPFLSESPKRTCPPRTSAKQTLRRQPPCSQTGGTRWAAIAAPRLITRPCSGAVVRRRSNLSPQSLQRKRRPRQQLLQQLRLPETGTTSRCSTCSGGALDSCLMWAVVLASPLTSASAARVAQQARPCCRQWRQQEQAASAVVADQAAQAPQRKAAAWALVVSLHRDSVPWAMVVPWAAAVL